MKTIFNKTTFLSCYFLFSFFTCLFSQEKDTTLYNMYLKGGSFVKAQIKTKEPNGIRVKFQSGEETFFSKRVLKKVRPINPNEFETPAGFTGLAHGNYFQVQTSIIRQAILTPKEQFTNTSPQINWGSFWGNEIMAGFRFTPYFALGGGLSFNYDDYQNHFRIFVHNNGFLFKKRITPFYDLKMGIILSAFESAPYPRTLIKDYEINLSYPTYFLHPTLGIRIHSLEKETYLVGMGLSFNRMRTNYTGDSSLQQDENFWVRSLSFNIGIEF